MLPFIKTSAKDTKIHPEETSYDYVLRFDGGSRGNPGRCGCGAVIYLNGKEIGSTYLYLGLNQTNNYAEYNGLIVGLKLALEMGIKKILVEGDSLLVINQLTNKFKCNSQNLTSLYMEVSELSGEFEKIEFHHILRHQNKRADELANKAMDEGNYTDQKEK